MSEDAKVLEERIAAIEQRLGIKTKEQLEKEHKASQSKTNHSLEHAYQRRRHP